MRRRIGWREMSLVIISLEEWTSSELWIFSVLFFSFLGPNFDGFSLVCSSFLHFVLVIVLSGILNSGFFFRFLDLVVEQAPGTPYHWIFWWGLIIYNSWSHFCHAFPLQILDFICSWSLLIFGCGLSVSQSYAYLLLAILIWFLGFLSFFRILWFLNPTYKHLSWFSIL